MKTQLNIEEMFSPKVSDKQYTAKQMLRISLILRTDSYKFSHPYAYPSSEDLGGQKIVGMTSYGTARVSPDVTVVPAGMQILTNKYLSQHITLADIDAAEAFAEKHFGRKLFARSHWEKVVNVYSGALPLVIRAVPEGTPIKGGQPIYTVSCFDRELWWMAAATETLIQRAIWYPTTIATMDRDIAADIKRFYDISGGDPALRPFALHDFGGRGVTVPEQAEVGGFAHLLSFMGSDTIEGVVTANHFYDCDMAAFSVYATEHAIECSFGPSEEQAIRYIRKQLRRAKELGVGIVSIVLDGYNVKREVQLCCTVLADDIKNCGAKVVFRPDSGDMMEIVPWILKQQEAAFGFDWVTGTTGMRCKQIRTVGIIQGDGVDHMAIKTLLGNIIAMGYSASCVVFGSGGALLQKVNRDTFKFAQKACAILLESEDAVQTWQGTAKDPITDSGKKSLEGVLTLGRHKKTGELKTLRIDAGELTDDYEDVHVLVYHTGMLFNATSMGEMRERVAV